jgi:hypothetical protein
MTPRYMDCTFILTGTNGNNIILYKGYSKRSQNICKEVYQWEIKMYIQNTWFKKRIYKI